MAEFFVLVTGLGVLLCLAIGFICAVYAGTGSKGHAWGDHLGLRHHWRGGLQVGGAAVGVDLVGQLVVNLAR